MNTPLNILAAVASLLSISAITTNTAMAAANTSPTSWELAGEFHWNASATAQSVWSYGSKTTLTCSGAAMTLLPSAYLQYANVIRGRGTVQAGGGPSVPAVFQNNNITPFTTPGGQAITLAPRALAMHPGPNGECAVTRFTAPSAGIYQVSGQYYALDSNGTGTNTNVYVMHNTPATTYDHSAVVQAVGGNRMSSFRVTNISLLQGQTIDFAVEMNGNYYYDTTGLHAVVELCTHPAQGTNAC